MMTAVAFFALRPSPFLSEVPGLQNGFGRWVDAHGVVRNVVAFAFVGLGVLAALPVSSRLRGAMALVGLGIVLELAQLVIPTRFCDWRDMVASAAGVGLALILLGLVGRVRRAWQAQRTTD